MGVITKMKDIFKTLISNTKKNASKDTFKKILWGLVGASSYCLIPTAVQGWFKTDMSGMKGMLTGVLSSSLIGLASNKPEMAIGAFSVMGAHLLYVKGNDTIATFMQSPIFAFDAAGTTMKDELPPGYGMINLPDGRQVIANSNARTSEPVSDYVQALPQASKANGGNLGDFVGLLPGQRNEGSLNDAMDRISMGNFN
jgi:hypothetical protein